MTTRDSLDPVQGLGKGDPNFVNRYARKLRDAGGALILPHQLAELSAAAKAEIEKIMEKAYGRRRE